MRRALLATTRAVLISARASRPLARPTLVFFTSPVYPRATSSATSTMASTAARVQPAPSLRDLKPPQHLGMKELDRSAFTLTVPLISARIPAGKVGGVRKNPLVLGQIVDIAKIRSVVPDEDPAFRRLVLRVRSEEELPAETRSYLQSLGASFHPFQLELGYDHWTAHDIISAIIPASEAEDLPSSFTQTGHIAHVNLRDEWLPYKTIIGQVIVDKIVSVTTVVNKLNTIHAEFRFFDMEVLAGPAEFVTTTSESGCTFTFDFSKVYWNSRLHTEHERLVSQFSPGSVVADAMAGVGPFACPAAKRGAYVLANDLNPESVKWAQLNRVKNKIEPRLRVTCEDARQFIRSAPMEAWTRPFERSEPGNAKLKEKEARKAREAAKAAGLPVEKKEEVKPRPQTIDHYVMNLPDSALEFLDAYAGAFTPLLSQPGYVREDVRLPMIHVHCFTRELDPEDASRDICARASERLGGEVRPDMDGFYLHPVRRVAPNKDMYCLSFRLPAEVAYRE